MLVVQPNVVHENADFDLDPEVLGRRWDMEDRHFWHAARNRWIGRALRHHGVRAPARVLDVGCGSGAVARALARLGHSVVGIDTAEVLVRKAHERLPQATFVAGSVEHLDPALGPFDVISFFDVLEHLDDPVALLRQALTHARPGALVIATVPALSALFSAVDVLSGHKRRYELGELERAFAEVDLVDIHAHGVFRLLWPLLRVRRTETRVPDDALLQRQLLLADMRVPPFPVNQLLYWACALEARLGFGLAEARPAPTLLVAGRVSSVARPFHNIT